MPIFRASYSVLSLWSAGNWEEAVKLYFKLDRFITPAMVEGKEFHKEWEKYINNHKRMPEVFGGAKLNNPKTELKLETQINDWLEVVGVIDLLDEPEFFDFKTGVVESNAHANSMQIPVYAVLCTTQNIYVEKASIWHYNQYTKKSDISQVWITDKVIADGVNWLETYGSEMHAYFLEHNLYKQLAQKK